MRQRLAIAISGLVAAAVLAVGLTAAGFGPAPRPVVPEKVGAASAEAAVENTKPEIAYVKPAPKPKTVVVKKRVSQRSNAAGSSRSGQVRATRNRDDDDEGQHGRERERESAEDHGEHEDD